MTDYTKISPLPWKREGSAWLGGVDSAEGDTVLTDEGVGMPGDLDYIVHCANAYPKLVEALRAIVGDKDSCGDDCAVRMQDIATDALDEAGEIE
jgi:hypothetical protein